MALGYFVDAEKYLGEAVASPDHPWVAKNLATLKAQLATAKTQIGELYIIGEPARRRGAGERQAGRPAAAVVADPPRQGARRRPGARARLRGVDGLGRRWSAASARIDRTGCSARRSRSRRRRRHPSRSPRPSRCEAKPAGAVGRRWRPRRPRAAARPGRIGSAAGVDHRDARAAPATAAIIRICGPVAWGVGIAGIAGLVFGAVEGVVAIKKRNEFNDHTGPDPANPLGSRRSRTATRPLPPPACQAIQDSHESARTLSIVGFVAGGVLDGGRGGAVGAVVAQGARGRLQLPPSPAPLISGRVVLLVGCSSRRSRDAA